MNDLEKIIDLINKDANRFLNPSTIADEIKKFIDSNPESGQINELWLFHSAMSFRIRDNKLSWAVKIPDGQGNYKLYPNPGILTPESLGIIEDIIEKCKSDVVASHLNLVSHFAGKRHNKYLENAKHGNEDLLQRLIEKAKSKEEKEKFNLLLEGFGPISNLLYIGVKLKDVESIKEKFIELLNDDKTKEIYSSLVQLMLDNTKVFKAEDFENIETELDKIGDAKPNRLNRIRYYDLAIRVAERCGKDQDQFIQKIADEYEHLGMERKDMAALTFLQKSMALNDRLNNEAASKRTTELYNKKNEEHKLQEFSTELDITSIVKIADDFIDHVKSLDKTNIIKHLIHASQLIPDKESAVKNVKENVKQDMFRYFVSNSIYDINGHVAEHFTTNDEVSDLLIRENYVEILRLNWATLSERLLLDIIPNKIIDFEDLIDYLDKHTWYGDNIKRYVGDGKYVTYKWLDLIKPGLRYYFQALRNELDYITEDYFTLPLDSLTLKIEGILRDLCRLINIPTHYTRYDKLDRPVTKEKDINMLLGEEELEAFLGEDLHMFLKMVFVKRDGWNLRNDIAHCFFMPQHYKSVTKINLAVIAILRLAKFKVNFEHSEEE